MFGNFFTRQLESLSPYSYEESAITNESPGSISKHYQNIILVLLRQSLQAQLPEVKRLFPGKNKHKLSESAFKQNIYNAAIEKSCSDCLVKIFFFQFMMR